MKHHDQSLLIAANMKIFIRKYVFETFFTAGIIFSLYYKIKTLYIYNIKRA